MGLATMRNHCATKSATIFAPPIGGRRKKWLRHLGGLGSVEREPPLRQSIEMAGAERLYFTQVSVERGVPIMTIHDGVQKWVRSVSDAAMSFESRWTMAALKRVDHEVHRRLSE